MTRIYEKLADRAIDAYEAAELTRKHKELARVNAEREEVVSKLHQELTRIFSSDWMIATRVAHHWRGDSSGLDYAVWYINNDEQYLLSFRPARCTNDDRTIPREIALVYGAEIESDEEYKCVVQKTMPFDDLETFGFVLKTCPDRITLNELHALEASLDRARS